MKIKHICLLQATCSIILMTTTYATSTETARQQKAEVNIQQAIPTRRLNFGEKTVIKIPSETQVPSPVTFNRNNGIISAQRQQTRNRPQTRVERIPLPTQKPTIPQKSGRYDLSSESIKNQLVTQQNQHDIPIVHKNRELFNKPITPTVGQQQQQQNSNRPRFSNTTENYQSTAIVKTITPQNRQHQRQRKPTTTHTEPSAINSPPPLSSRNANHNRTKQSSNVIQHRISSNNSQPLLTAVSAGGSQLKIGASSNKQRSNTNIKQSVSSTNTSIRLNTKKFSSTTTASTTTSKSTSTTTTTTRRPPFQLPSTFNIFSPEFWQFFIQPTSPPSKAVTTTKKPPKKYKPADPTSNKEEKINYSKHKTTISPQQLERIVNNSPKQNDGPFRIALPTFNILSTRRETADASEKDKRDVDVENLRNRFNCPRESEVRFQLFPKICKIDEDCEVWNRDELCCEIFGAKSCVSGIPKPLEETSHSPILGVIQRKCPSRPLAELWWEVKECETDMDCWPRVCCPDGRRRYCRTSQPELNTVPVPYRSI